MSKIDIESYKSFVGQQAILNNDEVEGVGIIVGISEEGEAVIQKCLDLEGLEETDETVLIPVEEVKLRTFVVVEKADEAMTEGALVSWETSNGTYYGDVQSVSMEGMVRGEPQGLEIEGSEQRPAYVVRVMMWEEDEWIPTNVTVVAYADALTAVEELPEPMDEEQPEDTPEDMPAMQEDGAKTMNIEKITEIVAREVAKALAGIDDVEVKSDEAAAEEPAAEEAAAEEASASEEVATPAVESDEVTEEEIDAYVAAETEEVVAEEEKAMVGAAGRIIATHKTAVERGAWDGAMNRRHVTSPSTPAYFNDIFAYQQPNTDGTMKAHYSFIHHFVAANGDAGAASMRALATAVAVLNGGRSGTLLRGAAREGVYRHIAAHYRDADMTAPELKSDAFVNELMVKNGVIAEAVVVEDEITEEKAAQIMSEESSVTETIETQVDETIEAKSEEAVVETATLTYNDLKELNDLFKVL